MMSSIDRCGCLHCSYWEKILEETREEHRKEIARLEGYTAYQASRLEKYSQELIEFKRALDIQYKIQSEDSENFVKNRGEIYGLLTQAQALLNDIETAVRDLANKKILGPMVVFPDPAPAAGPWQKYSSGEYRKMGRDDKERILVELCSGDYDVWAAGSLLHHDLRIRRFAHIFHYGGKNNV